MTEAIDFQAKMIQMNDVANSIAQSLLEMENAATAMTTLQMACAKMIFSYTISREDFDGVVDTLATQIKNMIDAEEADGNVRWEKAD